jgi:hypothetical protein
MSWPAHRVELVLRSLVMMYARYLGSLAQGVFSDHCSHLVQRAPGFFSIRMNIHRP